MTRNIKTGYSRHAAIAAAPAQPDTHLRELAAYRLTVENLEREIKPLRLYENLTKEYGLEVFDSLEELQRENAALRDLGERLKNEAKMHAQEARTANSIIAEINQCVSGATGEAGNWHGAEPVKKRIAELEQFADEVAAKYAALAGTAPAPSKDTALIRQFIESLDKDRHDTEDWPDDSRNALAALRARLEGKP